MKSYDICGPQEKKLQIYPTISIIKYLIWLVRSLPHLSPPLPKEVNSIMRDYRLNVTGELKASWLSLNYKN